MHRRCELRHPQHHYVKIHPAPNAALLGAIFMSAKNNKKALLASVLPDFLLKKFENLGTGVLDFGQAAPFLNAKTGAVIARRFQRGTLGVRVIEGYRILASDLAKYLLDGIFQESTIERRKGRNPNGRAGKKAGRPTNAARAAQK
jgi:hypothetical protein